MANNQIPPKTINPQNPLNHTMASFGAMVQAHLAAGIDVTSQAYQDGIKAFTAANDVFDPKPYVDKSAGMAP